MLKGEERVVVVYTVMMICCPKDVCDSARSTLTSESGRAKTKREDEVEIKQILPAVTQQDVILGINRNLAVRTFQIFLEKVTTWTLGYDKVHKISGTRESQMERLVEKRICRNTIVD